MLDGSWIPVPFVENSFIVNLGDLFPYWTNGVWRATPHKVIIKSEEKEICSSRGRLTIPYFGLVNADTLIECLPSCLKEGQDIVFTPILAGEFFSQHEKYSLYNNKQS